MRLGIFPPGDMRLGVAPGVRPPTRWAASSILASSILAWSRDDVVVNVDSIGC